jgi:hypothetical protein
MAQLLAKKQQFSTHKQAYHKSLQHDELFHFRPIHRVDQQQYVQ